MPDREKVIKTLTDALTAKENYPLAKAEMSFEFIEMLLELLKDQQEIVRCKDCIRYPDCCRLPRNDPNWFCADGNFRRYEHGEKDID